MLTELRIRNFAIIDSLTLPLAGGFNVLTGETGAGKSIIVGALGVLLGERASPDLIRTGADKATVEGVFDAARRPALLALLDERGIDAEDGTIVLRREIAASGRSRAWINDASTTAGVLAELGRALVDLHGQHEAQSLLDEESQRAILDAFAGAADAARRVRECFAALGEVTREIESLERRKADAERRADYLRHVVGEIESARLQPGEDARLEDEGRMLEHAEELRTLATSMAAALDGGEDAVLARLAHVQRSLAAIQRIDPTLARLQELFDSGFYALDELHRELDAYAAGVDLDPARLEAVQRRRDLLFRLAKKYGPALADVMETGRRSRDELALVDAGELDLRDLARRRDDARAALSAAAAELSRHRAGGGARLEREVDTLLPALGMPGGHLAVALARHEEIGSAGAEDVSFLVTLNVGHDARPLARIASGGELSRVMLALKTILARLDHVPTLVFDEVDAGIGGRVALQVGDLLRGVAEHHQVLVITHLPQIAARAHHHIVVSKGARGGITAADTAVVDGEDRVIELARMLGGTVSDASLTHARELLEHAAAVPPHAGSGRSAGRAAKRAGRRG